MLESVSRMAVAVQVIEQIKQMFDNGELQPGQRLPEEHILAQKLAANRTALREALRALEHAGVLESRTNGELYIASEMDASLNLRTVLKRYAHWETIEVRKIVETAAVALAVQRGKPDELQAMRKAHETMCLAVEDNQRFVLADVAFHRAIADAAGNSMLDSLMQSMWAMISGFNLVLLISRQEREIVIKHHEEILTAIENGNAEEAVRSLKTHLDIMAGVMRRQLEENTTE